LIKDETLSDAVDTAETNALARWLVGATHAQDVRILRYERLPGGAIQDNFLLDVDIRGGKWHGEHAFVLRTDAPTGVAASLSRAQEFAVLRVAHAAGVTAPKPLFLCRDTSVLGREFFIMARLPGVAQGHRLTREPALVPDGDALARELGANLARIHAIRPPWRDALSRTAALATDGEYATDDESMTIAPPPANPALATIAEYRGWLDKLDDAYPALEWGLRWCERHAPLTYDITLIHRDYRTGNYLVDAGRLTGVLDWEFAGFGDPREDIGWLTARCWRFSGADREAGGIAAIEPLLQGYGDAGGIAISRDDLDYWQVMAHLRWAIIALQQAQRHMGGGERSLELALTGRIVHELEYEVLQLITRSAR